MTPLAGEETITRAVAIDWDGLERALTRRSRESEAFLDTRTGDIVYLTRGWSDDHAFSDQELDEGLAARRLVPVLPVPPETELHWMRNFVESLHDGWTRDMLMSALEQPAPDLRFEDALGFFPEDRQRWLACRNARMAAVIRAWIEANDIEPSSEPPRRYRQRGHGGRLAPREFSPANPTGSRASSRRAGSRSSAG